MDKKIIVLDGGFSSQLSRHVKTPIDGHVLWTSRFTLTDKDAIVNTLLDYLKAGSDYISTNTYQASIDGFMKHLHLSKEESYNLIKESVLLAKNALELYKKENPNEASNHLIVGSVGPYGATLHDGSEYTGAYESSVSLDELMEWHRPRVDALIEAGVDLLAFETIPCKSEALALLKLLRDYPNMKAWLSFACKDDVSLVNGENFKEVARLCYNSNPKQIVAIGTNCVSPKYVANLFKDINKDQDECNKIPLIVYANSGETFDKGSSQWVWEEECIPLVDYVDTWVELGVRFIGGCCRTFAEDIAAIKQKVSLLNSKCETLL